MIPVLALDLATVSGWAIDGLNSVCPPRTGTFVMPQVQNRRYGRSMLSFERWLCAFIERERPQLVAYEAPLAPHEQKQQQLVMAGTQPPPPPFVPQRRPMIFTDHIIRILYGLVTITETVADALGCDYTRVTMFDARKHFTGQRTPENPKQVVWDRCRMLGWKIETLDESDAVAVWAYAKAKADRSFRLETGPLFLGAPT